MKHKTFFWFVLPSSLAMIIFILMPLISIVVQSLHVEHSQVMTTVENCGPFGCTQATMVNQEETDKINSEAPLGQFAGFTTYLDRGHLAVEEVKLAWNSSDNWRKFAAKMLNLPFYKALAFTLTFTFVVTPLVIILGFFIAVAVNSVTRQIKGPLIFMSLLPMIITPLVGALILFWMVDARGIVGATLQIIFDNPDLSVKASTPLMWIMLMVYGVWHSIPFAFIIYYAGLQTLNQDTLEAARIDGASRIQQIRYVVIPHLVPLTTFIALMQIMDNFRVFEPIISFAASAHATSLSWTIYDNLGGEIQQLSSAATTSVLTVIGVVILLSPVLVKTYRNFGRP